MEPTEEKSSSTIPKFLVYSAMLFVIARLTVFGYDIHFKSEVRNKPEIAWIDLTKKLTDKLNSEFYTKSNKSTTKVNISTLCPNCLLMKKEKISEPEDTKNYDLSKHVNEILDLDEQINRKPILYEFFANNSDPCKTMEQTALSNSQVVNLIKKNFTPVRVSYTPNESMSVTKSLVDFRRKYRVCAFPTLVVVDNTGKEVTNLVGNCSSLSTYKFLSRTVARIKTMPGHAKNNVALAETKKTVLKTR